MILNNLRGWLVEKIVGNGYCLINVEIKGAEIIKCKGGFGFMSNVDIERCYLEVDTVEEKEELIKKYPNNTKI